MNLNALTLDEIIRTVEPATDLERRLLSFLTDARYVNLDEHECLDCKDKDDLEEELEGVCVNHNTLKKDLASFIRELKDAIESFEE